jgi:uncharacterized repeat protein (TIGR04076 family)
VPAQEGDHKGSPPLCEKILLIYEKRSKVSCRGRGRRMSNKVKVTVLKTPTEAEILAADFAKEIVASISTKPCPQKEGQEYLVDGDWCQMPKGFCQHAWRVILPVVAIVAGGGRVPKEPALQNILSCPRGIKPTVFKIDRA